MQLIIESESISDKKMSALDETQDKQNDVITDIKKDLQNIKDDVNKDGASDLNEKLITEAKTNGDIETSNVNGTESPNNDKENDAPKMDMSLDAEEEESIENITNCVNGFFGLTEDSNSDSLGEKVITETPKLDNEIDSIENDSAKEGDTKMEIDDDVNNDKTESPNAQIVDESTISELSNAENEETKEESSSSLSKPDDNFNGDTCQDSVEPAKIRELPIEIETPEKMEIDPNSTVESESIVDDSASNLENIDKIPENVGLNDAVSNDANKVPLQDSGANNDTACDNVHKTKIQDEVTEDASCCLKTDENSTENTATFKSDTINANENVSEQQTDTKIVLGCNSIQNDDNIADDLLSEVKIASPSKDVVENETAADVVLAPNDTDSDAIENETSHINALTIDIINDIAEDKLSDKESSPTEVDLDPCEKLNVAESKTLHDDVTSINSTNDLSEDKLSDKENHASNIDLDPCEKVNLADIETSHDDATNNDSNDNSEDKLCDKENDKTEIDRDPCEKVDLVENETSHDDVPKLNDDNSEDKLSDKIENHETKMDLDPCEKVNVVENEESHDDAPKLNDSNDNSEDKSADNTNVVPCEKVADNVTQNAISQEDTPVDTTGYISEEKNAHDKHNTSSKENSSESQEKLPDNKSVDVTDTTSTEQKESDSSVIGPKESDKIENEVPKTPEMGNKKEVNSVSISNMSYDAHDEDILPEKKNSESKEIEKEAIELLLGDNNVIEILDQDPTENNTDKVENLINKESQDTKPDETKSSSEIKNKYEISDEDDIKIIEESKTEAKKEPEGKTESKPLVICKLSNTLDILSDDEEEPPLKKAKTEEKPQPAEDKQCINLDDDDDIVLIEDTKEPEKPMEPEKPVEPEVMKPEAMDDEPCEKETKTDVDKPTPEVVEKDILATETDSAPQLSEKEAEPSKEEAIKEPPTPLLPLSVLKSAKKNLSEMTRDELEEFCILKIVEGIVDRGSLSEIKHKMKVIGRSMEEYKKKALMLAKQNRDLQVVLKSVQEEQKNRPSNAITPLKITRSVGMQVLMFDKFKKKSQQNNTNAPRPVNRAPTQNPRPQRPQANNQNIPVPKLIPASPAKVPNSPIVKPPTPNGIRSTPSPAQKNVEKRPLTRQAVASTSNAMTVDLTDDDPPAKVPKNSPVPPVRLVPSQTLMAPRPQLPGSNPRKVFIPINGAGQTVLLKNLGNQQQMGPRGRFPAVPRMPHNQVRMAKVSVNRHPAPLPDVMKQYQPPTWKALPPAPDLKLSKVENGIVISWKIEGYQEDSYEKIASYQLYAYQETSTPPSTALWKKIGDVKALPLPMACTLTQFMAGFKYYFAVRAVDVKSRLGPFSLPGSILLLNKM